jgi:hypothetical protein
MGMASKHVCYGYLHMDGQILRDNSMRDASDWQQTIISKIQGQNKRFREAF